MYEVPPPISPKFPAHGLSFITDTQSYVTQATRLHRLPQQIDLMRHDSCSPSSTQSQRHIHQPRSPNKLVNTHLGTPDHHSSTIDHQHQSSAPTDSSSFEQLSSTRNVGIRISHWSLPVLCWRTDTSRNRLSTELNYLTCLAEDARLERIVLLSKISGLLAAQARKTPGWLHYWQCRTFCDSSSCYWKIAVMSTSSIGLLFGFTVPLHTTRPNHWLLSQTQQILSAVATALSTTPV